MRGVFIQDGLEFRLEVTGDDFFQGNAVPCLVSVKSHSDSSRTLSDLRLYLALGNLKKVRAKAQDSFDLISCAEYPPTVELAAGEQKSFSWNFQLDQNCAISDKNQSPYLLYGNSSDASAVGQLPLTVQIHPYIQAIFGTLETVFQFVLKGNSSKGGWTTTKFKPPTARRFSFVEELNLSCHFDNEALQLKYLFNVKKFNSTEVGVNVTKGKTEVEQRYEASQYLFAGKFVNQEFLEGSINDALAVVSSGL